MAKKQTYSNLYVKRRLTKLEIDIFTIITQGLVQKLGKRKIMLLVKKQILSLTVLMQLSDLEKNRLWLQAQKMYLDISKKSFPALRKAGEDVEARHQAVYSSCRAYILNGDLVKNANQVMYDYEFRIKHDALYGPEGLLEVGKERRSPFFLASAHPNPACGHESFQGKVFVDEDWESYVPEADKKRIRAYIRNHQIRTVQDVCGEPVWLCTRRNCKHFLKNIPTEEILHSSARALCKKHGMIRPEDKPASRKILYYRSYYNRLKIEEYTMGVIPNEKLKSDISKDKKLLAKWKSTL